jgi:Queuine tRNA-ribosyltransferase
MMSLTPDLETSTKASGSAVGHPNSQARDNSRLRSVLENLKKPFSWSRPPPTFIVPTSRGSVPHLTPDNLHLHTNIPTVHIGLEDFITPPAQNSAILSIQSSLHQYLAFPERTQLFFSARKANPVPINASWNDKIEVHTVDGRCPVQVDTIVNAVKQVHLRDTDAVISIPDTTESPGVKRLGKMVERTQKWLDLLLKSNVLVRERELMIAWMSNICIDSTDSTIESAGVT